MRGQGLRFAGRGSQFAGRGSRIAVSLQQPAAVCGFAVREVLALMLRELGCQFFFPYHKIRPFAGCHNKKEEL